MAAQAPPPALTFAVALGLGAAEMRGGSLGLLERLTCQLGRGAAQEQAVDAASAR